jgi:hypothetical protein
MWRVRGTGLNTIMKQINEIKPYTYLVKFKPTGKVYYGSRCQNFTKFNRTPAEDFWNHYTTSSENINNLIDEHGKDAFEYEIRRTFNSVEDMADWETRVLTRSRVLERQDRWMNGNVAGYKIVTEAGAKKISETHKDRPKSEEHKKNLSLSQKGKPKNYIQTTEHRQLNSEANSGKNNPRYGVEVLQSTRDKIGKANKGKVPSNKGTPMTEEQKVIIRATKEKNKVMLTCEICNKTMRASHYKIYKHGPICQQKP